MFRLPFMRSRPGDLVLGRVGPFRFFPSYRVPKAARATHMYVIGITGRGKSKLLEHCLYQDIAAGTGCGCIDPNSQLIDDLIRLLITRGVWGNSAIGEKVLYIDPGRTDYVVPFNVLVAGDTYGTPYDIAATVLEAFRRTWPESLSEAPHFSNVVTAALITLIANSLTLMHMPALLTNQDFRERCLAKVTDHSVVEFFHDRFDKWGKDAAYLKESTLNKVGAFSMNPRLKIMLGQKENHLDFRALMDEGWVLLLDLGRCDSETERLIGSLVVTGLEAAMRRRHNRNLWSLTIDEFARYVANEGSVKTLAHVFSEGRKYKMSMTVAHQDLSQLTPRMLGALSNVQTKVVFGVGRTDSEVFAKMIGRVDTEAVKREPLTETQHELFSTLAEQWEAWANRLQFQPPRRATVASLDGRVANLWTTPIPPYRATENEVEAAKRESVARWGIPYAQAQKNIEALLGDAGDREELPISEPV